MTTSFASLSWCAITIAEMGSVTSLTDSPSCYFSSDVLWSVFVVAIIYLAWQIVKRWGKLARHETFNAFIASIVGWSAVAGVVIPFLVPNDYKLMVGVVFSIIYYTFIGGYFTWDYRVHKKPRPKGISDLPLSVETVETPTPSKKPRTKWAIAGIILVFMLEVFESAFFILIIVTWQAFTVSNVPVLTYQNAFLIGAFIFGVFLAIDISRKLRSKKAFFGDE